MCSLAALLIWSCGFSGQESPGDSRQELLAWARTKSEPESHGMYLGGVKVGWSITERRAETFLGRDRLVVEEESYLQIEVDGERSVSQSRSRKEYSLEGAGLLMSYEELEEEDGARREVRGFPSDDRFVIEFLSLGGSQRRVVDPPRENLTDSIQLERWLAGGPQVGEAATLIETDLMADEINRQTRVEYAGSTMAGTRGGVLPAHRIVMETDGIAIESVVLDDFRLVSAHLNGIIEVRTEDPETVRQMEAATIDITQVFAIPCDEALGDPGSVRFLELEVNGLGSQTLPVDARQKLVEENGRKLLRLWRDPDAGPGQRLTEDEVRSYTAPTTRINSDHPRILQQVYELTGLLEDPRDVASTLMEWVGESLIPTYTRNGETALEVLTSKAGDCTEHALLFTALARARGLPSRVVGGVMYVGDEAQEFQWHAWAEFHDGQHWISVDPTWGQLPVDATHILLDQDGLDGDESWLGFVGTLELWVIDSEGD